MGTENELTATYEFRQLKDLHPFPLQAELFPPCSEAEDIAFRENIRKNGNRDFIQVLPKNKAGFATNTVLCGHRRRNALIALGETEVEVCIRHDLANASKAEFEREFIDSNLHRRQLKGLGMARCIARLFEIERGREPGELQPNEITELRERVGQHLDMTGRNVDRYMNLLKAPISLQSAYEDRRIDLDVGARVGAADAETQQQIAELIESGVPAKEAIGQVLGGSAAKAKKGSVTLAQAVKSLQKANQQLEGVLQLKKRGELTDGDVEVLNHTKTLCEELILPRPSKPRQNKKAK